MIMVNKGYHKSRKRHLGLSTWQHRKITANYNIYRTNFQRSCTVTKACLGFS